MSFNYTVSWYVGAVRSCANNIFYLKKFLSDCCFIRLFNHIGVRNLSYEFSCITTIIIKSSSTRRLPMASKVWYGYVEIRLSLYKCCKNLMIDCYNVRIIMSPGTRSFRMDVKLWGLNPNNSLPWWYGWVPAVSVFYLQRRERIRNKRHRVTILNKS